MSNCDPQGEANFKLGDMIQFWQWISGWYGKYKISGSGGFKQKYLETAFLKSVIDPFDLQLRFIIKIVDSLFISSSIESSKAFTKHKYLQN